MNVLTLSLDESMFATTIARAATSLGSNPCVLFTGESTAMPCRVSCFFKRVLILLTTSAFSFPKSGMA
jgi:hypothetical protein